MPRTNLSMSISADGYVAGPNQSEEHPLGIGGELLHGWHIGPAKDHPVNQQVAAEMLNDMGATIMGRNMFGPVRGDWGDSAWSGWWGDEPPYHCPVFVLTHHARDSIVLRRTTFHFVTDGVESAHAQAVEAAGDRPISIAGGASCARQAIRAGIVDEIDLQVNPVILGSGKRLSTASMRLTPASNWSESSRRPAWPTCVTASCGDGRRHVRARLDEANLEAGGAANYQSSATRPPAPEATSILGAEDDVAAVPAVTEDQVRP